MSIEVSQRRAVFALLKPYCHLSGPDDYIEVTEWSNGEGYTTRSYDISSKCWRVFRKEGE